MNVVLADVEEQTEAGGCKGEAAKLQRCSSYDVRSLTF